MRHYYVHRDEYYMARVEANLEPEINPDKSLTFFSCDPGEDAHMVAHFATFSSFCKYEPKVEEEVDPKYTPVCRCGLLFRKESLWVGAHYSPYNRRWCINLLPFVTLWITLKGGKTP